MAEGDFNCKCLEWCVLCEKYPTKVSCGRSFTYLVSSNVRSARHANMLFSSVNMRIVLLWMGIIIVRLRFLL